jgi:hypothetical protein
MNITISDDDLDAVRTIRHARDRKPLDGVQTAALDRIIAAAERPPPAAPDTIVDERTCFMCGDTCTRDLARMLWNCRGCLATFIDDRQPTGQRSRELSMDARLGSRAPLDSETPLAVCVGDSLACRDESLAVGQPASGNAPTTRSSEALATAVLLYPLPRGGRVVFSFGDGDRSVYLPGRRFDLVRALLAPRVPYIAGELIPNAALIEHVWYDNVAFGGRRELNVLVTRCRQDLAAAGIATASLLERAPGGGATRLRLAPGAGVIIAMD